jgi:carboxylesterase
VARTWPLLAGAEAFEHPGTADIGVLLVHGFTGSPAEMRPLGLALAEHGVGSFCPLLRGHGTHPDDLLTAHYHDWIDDVDRGLDRLLETYARAVVIGLSMGGTLALNVAARRHHDGRIAGVVTICAPLVLDDWRLRFVNVLGRLVKWQAWGAPDILDQGAWHRHIGYRRFRSRSIVELLALMGDTNARLADVRQPILIVQARDDHVVPPRNAQLIHAGVGSIERRVLLLDDCYHIVTVDFAAARLNEAVVAFVEHLAHAATPASTPLRDLP